MKRYLVVFVLLISAGAARSQSVDKDFRYSPKLPSFTSVHAALSFAERQFDVAQNLPEGADRVRLFLDAVSGARAVQEWKDVDAKTEGRAAVVGAESFLYLQASENCRDVIRRLSFERLHESGVEAQLMERNGESFERLGDVVRARASYVLGLEQAKAAAGPWRNLLLYRAGLSSVRLGFTAEAIAYLEEVAPQLQEDTVAAVLSRAMLSSVYRGKKDKARAKVWAEAASRILATGVVKETGEPGLPKSFVKEVGLKDLAAIVSDALAKSAAM